MLQKETSVYLFATTKNSKLNFIEIKPKKKIIKKKNYNSLWQRNGSKKVRKKSKEAKMK